MSKPAEPLLPESPSPFLQFFRGVKTFLRALLNRPQLWGNEVDVTFAGSGTDTRVDHGLGYPATGWWVVKSTVGVNVYQSPSTPSTNTSLTLRASAAGAVTLYVY